ncbi:hypothetical protein [Pseudovibrio sp. Tun.PSC04-5.I4]|uniref:hypothetical protein n=1 Tax=Pseudovibrio sp. Tun.PSC04-5.I4 TaxID=1798213 RepID=UPI0013562F05|nr:hypothetical protein [Pseudovibrio sp. Tun.PSC04-5.I4]
MSDLTERCKDPGVSGDKGKDAIRHRAALVACEAKRLGWQAFYGTVKDNLKGGVK